MKVQGRERNLGVDGVKRLCEVTWEAQTRTAPGWPWEIRKGQSRRLIRSGHGGKGHEKHQEGILEARGEGASEAVVQRVMLLGQARRRLAQRVERGRGQLVETALPSCIISCSISPDTHTSLLCFIAEGTRSGNVGNWGNGRAGQGALVIVTQCLSLLHPFCVSSSRHQPDVLCATYTAGH